MPKAVMIVWSDPSDPSREDEFNDWYNSTHAPDMMKVPGFVACTRYKVSDVQLGPVETPGSYVAYYEIETDDLASTPEAIMAAFSAGELPTTDVIVPGPIVFLEPASDRIT